MWRTIWIVRKEHDKRLACFDTTANTLARLPHPCLWPIHTNRGEQCLSLTNYLKLSSLPSEPHGAAEMHNAYCAIGPHLWFRLQTVGFASPPPEHRRCYDAIFGAPKPWSSRAPAFIAAYFFFLRSINRTLRFVNVAPRSEKEKLPPATVFSLRLLQIRHQSQFQVSYTWRLGWNLVTVPDLIDVQQKCYWSSSLYCASYSRSA